MRSFFDNGGDTSVALAASDTTTVLDPSTMEEVAGLIASASRENSWREHGTSSD